MHPPYRVDPSCRRIQSFIAECLPPELCSDPCFKHTYWRMAVCLIVCSRCLSYQHLRSYQDGYRLVTARTHDDFIILPHWKTRPPAPWPDITRDHIIPTLSQPIPCPILIMPSAWVGSDNCKYLSHWFDPRDSDSLISQNGSQILYSLCHPDWFTLQ